MGLFKKPNDESNKVSKSTIEAGNKAYKEVKKIQEKPKCENHEQHKRHCVDCERK